MICFVDQVYQTKLKGCHHHASCFVASNVWRLAIPFFAQHHPIVRGVIQIRTMGYHPTSSEFSVSQVDRVSL